MAYMICISSEDGTSHTKVEVPDAIPLPSIGDMVGVRTDLPRPVKARWFSYDNRDQDALTVYLELERRQK